MIVVIYVQYRTYSVVELMFFFFCLHISFYYMVPEVGLEPTRLSAGIFETPVAAITPLGQYLIRMEFVSYYKLEVCCLSFLRNPSFELKSRVPIR